VDGRFQQSVASDEVSSVPTDGRHRDLFTHAPRATPWVIVALIAGGLALDARWGWPGQIATVVLTVAVWGWLYAASGRTERRVLILCTIISGIGEVFLSLVWGLYDYQFHNVPLFVPPGHALLMTLGLIIMRHVGRRGVIAITFTAVAWAVYAGLAGFDRFGVALLSLYLVCTAFGPAKNLYATMFVLALIMELYGTALGNWRWEPIAPWLGLTQANPPFSAGALYCALDLLVLAALRLWDGTTEHKNVKV
jgi:hypothetical protein